MLPASTRKWLTNCARLPALLGQRERGTKAGGAAQSLAVHTPRKSTCAPRIGIRLKGIVLGTKRTWQGGCRVGRWPVRFAEAGTYLTEVRHWPREADAPLAGVPASGRVADAATCDRPVRELLYLPGGPIRALPVARVQLKVGSSVQEAAVGTGEKCITFTTKVDAGPTDIEATLRDESGKALCSAFYVRVRKSPQTKQ